MSRTRTDPVRVAAVLAGVAYPARTWQLLAQADYYGADTHTHAELRCLPVGSYESLDAVLAALRRLSPAAGPRTITEDIPGTGHHGRDR